MGKLKLFSHGTENNGKIVPWGNLIQENIPKYIYYHYFPMGKQKIKKSLFYMKSYFYVHFLSYKFTVYKTKQLRFRNIVSIKYSLLSIIK